MPRARRQATTSRRPWSGGGADRPLRALMPRIGRLLEAVRRAGTVRPDVAVTDLVVLLMSVRGIADLCDDDAPGASRRFLELALDGLRPGGDPPAQPPMSARSWARPHRRLSAGRAARGLTTIRGRRGRGVAARSGCRRCVPTPRSHASGRRSGARRG